MKDNGVLVIFRKVMNPNQADQLISILQSLQQRVDAYLPMPPTAPDFAKQLAFRWRKKNGHGFLQPVAHPHNIRFTDLLDCETQRERIEANTRQFVQGKPANNVLLTGARGTGKSSLVKAAFNQFSRKNLRLIEVDKADLVDLADITDLIAHARQRFIIFCDDLSFEANDPGYKSLKVALDGSIANAADNTLIYATSNRRHLMPEKMSENMEAVHADNGEIHPGETTEEKISLSERFGLCLTFYGFDQEQYLGVAKYWVEHYLKIAENRASLGGAALLNTELDEGHFRKAALLWALERGARSGRVAVQFAKDYVGSRK